MAYNNVSYKYQKVVSFGDKILFINTGSLYSKGLIVEINSTFHVTKVLTLNAGMMDMAYSLCSVESFNGGLYFHLLKDFYTGVITSLTELVSS